MTTNKKATLERMACDKFSNRHTHVSIFYSVCSIFNSARCIIFCTCQNDK